MKQSLKIVFHKKYHLVYRKFYSFLQKKKMLKKLLFSSLILAVITGFKPPQDILWYKTPAQNWMEALPLGNGRIGMMAFGNPESQHFQLNDDSMWPNHEESWSGTPGRKTDLEEIRRLLFEGRNPEADKLFVEKFSNKSILRSHQTLGDLFIDFDSKNYSDYKRSLNLNTGTFEASYTINGKPVKIRAFVSKPKQVMVIEINAKAALSGEIRLKRPDDKGVPTSKTEALSANELLMTGEVLQMGGVFRNNPKPIKSGVKFATLLKVNNLKGNISKTDSTLRFNNLKSATFIISSNSSYYSGDFTQKCFNEQEKVSSISGEELWKEHEKDHRSLYDRLDLNLTQKEADDIPTDERLAQVKAGKPDPTLDALLFQYGRYLLIGSSRPGTLPANLQGLWNNDIQAPWNADYHLNINLQMNYWLANGGNLGNLNQPLFDYIDKAIENGKTTAMENFGCRGSFLAHATDLWAVTWLRSNTAYWGCSMGAGGWMMQHYWEHYRYTKDLEFLKKRAFPAMHEVAQFYSDWLIEDPRDGSLISAPSTSPENRFYNEKGEESATCLGSAMDQQVIEELFRNYLSASEILKIDNHLTKKIKEQLPKLRPGFKIGLDGRVLEWDRPYKEFEPGHRHISHIYGFHPGSSVSLEQSPELFQAVKKTLDYRLENGGAGPGWSRAWLINCAARLFNEKMAYENIQALFKKSTAKNLFNEHPPFQIDGNFGYTNGVMEMLLQSHEEGIIRILPTLPKEWNSGYITGIKARGGLEFDIFWEDGSLSKLKIKAEKDAEFELIYKELRIPVSLKAGEVFEKNL